VLLVQLKSPERGGLHLGGFAMFRFIVRVIKYGTILSFENSKIIFLGKIGEAQYHMLLESPQCQ